MEVGVEGRDREWGRKELGVWGRDWEGLGVWGRDKSGGGGIGSGGRDLEWGVLGVCGEGWERGRDAECGGTDWRKEEG